MDVLELKLTPEPWMDQSACSLETAHLFEDYLDLGDRTERQVWREERHAAARALCAECQVLAECDAQDKEGMSGIVAGELLPDTYRYPPLEPGDPRHGTATGYNNHHCHCTPCLTVKAQSSAEWRDKVTEMEDASNG